MDKVELMEAKLMDLEYQVTKINGALNILYSKYNKEGGKGWPYEDIDLPVLVPLGEDETLVKIEDVKRIIAKLAEESSKQFFKKRFIKTGLSTRSTPSTPSTPPPDDEPPADAPAPAVVGEGSEDAIIQIVGGKKKTYKKRHTKKKRRHTKRRSTKRKHYKKTRKH
jgi:hypothetical protein